jgi:hypothetical protein
MTFDLKREDKQPRKKDFFWKRTILIDLIIVISILSALFTGIESNVQDGIQIVIDSDAKSYQLFYDSGNGFSQSESIFSKSAFSLPDKKIRRIRIDPLPYDTKKTVSLRSIKIYSKHYKDLIVNEELSNFLTPYYQVSKNEHSTDNAIVKIHIDGNDPQLLFNYSTEELERISTPKQGISKNGFRILFLISLLLSVLFLILRFRNKIFYFFNALNQFIDGGHKGFDAAQPQTTNKPTTVSIINNSFTSNIVYWSLFLIASISYIALYLGSSVNLITWANYDDLLYFSQAESIIGGNWLGTYNPLTLAKVPGYAIFLAGCMFFRIPYLLLISLCNTIATAFLLKKSMWLFNKARFLSLILGVILLFNPFFNGELRIYRNQLAAIAFTVFLATLIALFDPNAKKESGFMKVFQALIAFVGFGFLFYTRDESILYYAILSLALILFLLVFKKVKYPRRNLYLLVAGSLGIVFLWLTISMLNYSYYGRFITCERTYAPFTNVIHSFHSVDDPSLNSLYPKSSTTREKVLNVEKFVPEFTDVAKIMIAQPPINMAFVNASTYLDRKELQFKSIDPNDLPTSHFDWFWIQCIEEAGYYSSASVAAQYYERLDEGIKKAIKDGHLMKRKIVISFGTYILAKEDINTIFRVIPKNYFQLLPTQKRFILNYSNFTQRIGVANNNIENLKVWKNSLKVNSLHSEEKSEIDEARSSLSNRFWNFWIKLFAFTVLPILHSVFLLTLISVVISALKKNWVTICILILLTASFAANFLLLTIIDVTAGYRASSIPYYLPAYVSVIVCTFISIQTLIISFRNTILTQRRIRIK